MVNNAFFLLDAAANVPPPNPHDSAKIVWLGEASTSEALYWRLCILVHCAPPRWFPQAPLGVKIVFCSQNNLFRYQGPVFVPVLDFDAFDSLWSLIHENSDPAAVLPFFSSAD
jgi:hypothetical protein